jgi:ankyrin repeat protein
MINSIKMFNEADGVILDPNAWFTSNVVKSLISEIHKEITDCPYLFNTVDRCGRSVFSILVELNEIEALKEFIKKSGTKLLNVADINYRTPLSIAAVKSYEMVKYLLCLGAIPNALPDRDVTPLHFALANMNGLIQQLSCPHDNTKENLHEQKKIIGLLLRHKVSKNVGELFTKFKRKELFTFLIKNIVSDKEVEKFFFIKATLLNFNIPKDLHPTIINNTVSHDEFEEYITQKLDELV